MRFPTATLALIAFLISSSPTASSAPPASPPHCPTAGTAVSLGKAVTLATNRIVTDPTSGCTIWKVGLSIGDKVTLKVAAGSGEVYIGFLTNGLTDGYRRNGVGLTDVRGTDCHMTVPGGGADEETCVVAGRHAYYLQADQYGKNARLGVYVVHSPRQVGGTCSLFGRAPLIPLGVTEYSEVQQRCPTRAILQYEGTDPSPYPFVERWSVDVTRSQETLIFSGFLVTTRVWNRGSDTGMELDVERPVADPTEFPGEKICSIIITPRPASTRCTFPSPGDYIVNGGGGGYTVGFSLRQP